jgi:hypothetical protein
LKEGLSNKDLSSQTPLAKDKRGPPLGLPSTKTKGTSWEAKTLSCSLDSAPRNESSWSRVLPLAPAATRLSNAWIDSGENTRFECLPSSPCSSRLPIPRAKSDWPPFNPRRSIVTHLSDSYVLSPAPSAHGP